jgi:hypothetical protein
MPVNTDHVISAVSSGLIGLIGVLVGGGISWFAQRRARRNARRAEQLNAFYAPLFGIVAEIRARSEVRLLVDRAASAAWTELVARRQAAGRGRVDDDDARFAPVIDYNNRQLADVLLPLYRRMVKHFAENIGYAEPSTLKHFPALVEFVEVWERWLDKSLPAEAAAKLQHDETKLFPLYREIAVQLDRLQAEVLEPLFPIAIVSRIFRRGTETDHLAIPREARSQRNPVGVLARVRSFFSRLAKVHRPTPALGPSPERTEVSPIPPNGRPEGE